MRDVQRIQDTEEPGKVQAKTDNGFRERDPHGEHAQSPGPEKKTGNEVKMRIQVSAATGLGAVQSCQGLVVTAESRERNI